MIDTPRNSNRIAWVDNAKAIGIFFVLLGHVPFLHNIFKIWIYSFHMPLFFFLAGITFKAKDLDIKTLFKKKFNGLIVPYFIFSVFTLIFGFCKGDYCIGNHIDFLKLIKKIFGIIFFQIRRSNWGNDIWFPSCLLISFLLLFLILKTNFKLRVLLVTCSVIIGYLYAEFVGQPLPWGIDVALIAVIFLYVGKAVSVKLIKTLDVLKPGKLLLILGLSGVLNVVFAVLNYKLSGIRVDMWNCNYGNLILFLLSSSMGIIAVLAVAKLFSCNIISEFGQGSLYYYGMHQQILVLLCSFIPTKNITIDLLSGLLASFIAILILAPLKGVYERILKRLQRIIK